MPRTEWRLKGDWIKNCNCAFGCPCDFNARPTNGNCKGLVGMHITDGHFGDVRLNGLNFCATVDFPGPLLSGQNSAEGTIFHIFSLIVTKMLDPIFAPIRFDFDLPGRRAKISIPGVLETENEPIRNPVTGAPHRIQIVMPEGFEHRSAEVCSSRIESTGGIKFNVPQGHGSLATVEQTPEGVAA